MTGTAALAATLTTLINHDPGVTEILPPPKKIGGILTRSTRPADLNVQVTESPEAVTVSVSVCTNKTAPTPETLRRLATTITSHLATTGRPVTVHIHVASID